MFGRSHVNQLRAEISLDLSSCSFLFVSDSDGLLVCGILLHTCPKPSPQLDLLPTGLVHKKATRIKHLTWESRVWYNYITHNMWTQLDWNTELFKHLEAFCWSLIYQTFCLLAGFANEKGIHFAQFDDLDIRRSA